jgi:hypothetical protein
MSKSWKTHSGRYLKLARDAGEGFFTEPISKQELHWTEVRRMTLAPIGDNLNIDFATLGNKAGFMGAAHYAMHFAESLTSDFKKQQNTNEDNL